MQFREDIPKILPTSTLAVPPFKFDKMECKRLNLYDVNLEMSEEYESYLDDGESKNIEGSQKMSKELLKSSKNKGLSPK